MHVLITAGGTKEPIDSVRAITNTSTGKLAYCIHEALIEMQSQSVSELTIHYVAANAAYLPSQGPSTIVYRAYDTLSVKDTIESILKNHHIDWMIHAMAISDYYVESVNSTQAFTSALIEGLQKSEVIYNHLTDTHIQEILEDTLNQSMDRTKKISSDDELILKLAKTPKIIKSVKAISPYTKLIGFKLLHNATEDDLIVAADKQQKACNCEFVVANDSSNITREKHEAIFISNGTITHRCSSKEAIANRIAKEVLS